MNRDELRRALLETLSDVAPEGDFERLVPERPLRDQLDIDSYDFLQWVVALHERLGIDIPETDYPRLATLNSAVEYLAVHGALSQS